MEQSNITKQSSANYFEYKCNKCGHKWKPRINGTPIQCPYCKSNKWNQTK